ncbi:4-hydroxy-tetrahydrodipicolinate synthase [Gordonia malaquae]|uniref:4-hydroxy-tetrahydrodipicolinate synthase n=1 Tax=Gordonia malaquae TaxID=410332 RepID=UPI0030FEF0B4
MTTPSARAFGTNLVAMPTPMNPDFSLDDAGITSLVKHLVDTGCDGVVVAGTTGESPTLSEDELVRLVELSAAAAGGRAKIVAGVGTNDTVSSVRRARLAAHAGADGLLVVTPYYSRPTQTGVVSHCSAIADSTDLPVMLYDVPHRTGLAMTPATLIELAGHPRILAVKDATGDIPRAMAIMATSTLEFYCGSDELNLPFLAAGAIGIVSVVGAVIAADEARLIAAVRTGDLVSARSVNAAIIETTAALNGAAPAPVTTKLALVELGVIASATVRPPLEQATGAEAALVLAALKNRVPASA